MGTGISNGSGFFGSHVKQNLTISNLCDLSEVVLPSDGSCYLIPNLDAMRVDISERLKKG